MNAKVNTSADELAARVATPQDEASRQAWEQGSALPCPPWCVTSHERDTDNNHHHHADRPIGDYGTGWVALLMVDYGDSVLASANGGLNIHVSWRYASGEVKTVVRPLGEAEQFAELARAFGRDDVAALICELATLAQDGAT